MPTMSENRTNSKGEMLEIKRRLQEDGLNPACTEEEKIRHLWKLYLKTQSDLEASLTHIEELRQQQSEEMAEVENYVEHIRNLSDEREALTTELEAENEQLKAEMEKLQEDLQENQQEEMREMLLQQGLDDIAEGMASEQIAYLLVERARLLDELEAEQTKNIVDTPEGQLSAPDLLKILETERAEFEDELRQQRDSLRGIKAQMENAHEDEVMSMMAENEKLQGLLDQAKKKTVEMENEVQELKDELTRKVDECSRLQMQLSGDLEDEARNHEVEQEIQTLHGRVQELKADNETLAANLKIMTAELQSERDSIVGQADKNSTTVKSLQSEVEKHLASVMTLENANQKLNQDKKTLEKQLDFAEKELDDFRNQQKQWKAKQKFSHGESLEQLKLDIVQLSTENSELRNELSSIRHKEFSNKSSNAEDETVAKIKEHHTREVETLHAKLSVAQQLLKEKEEQVKWEKQRNSEHLSSGDHKLSQAYNELDKLRQANQEIQTNLAKKEQELRQAYLKLKSEEVITESNVGSLKTEIGTLKETHQTEINRLTNQLDQSHAECRELRSNLHSKELDISSHEADVTKLTNAVNRLESHLQSSEKTRADLLKQSKELLEEKDRAWVDIRGLMKQVDALQSAKEILQAELNMKSTSAKESELLLNRQSSEQQRSLQTVQQRAEAAEKKLSEQQRDLQEALSRLQLAEAQLQEMAELRQNLHQKEGEIILLRNQLQEAEVHKSLQHASGDDLKHQVTALKQKERELSQRNNELQHMLLDMEAKMETMKDNTKSVTHVRSSAEESRKSLLEELATLKRENDKMQMVLLHSSEKYDHQLTRYNERKLRTKDKLNKAREVLTSERVKYHQEVERLSQELNNTNSIIARENEWKATMEENIQKMIMEKREMLSQITEQEETVRDHQRAVQVLEVRTRYLEEENTNLQERISSLTRQKQTLDRIIKEYQLERHREPNVRMEKIIQYIEAEERAIQKMTPETALLLSPRGSMERIGGLYSSKRAESQAENQLLEAIMSPRVQSPAMNTSIHLSCLLPGAGGIRESMDSDIVNL